MVASARMLIDARGNHLGIKCDLPETGKYDGLDVIRKCLITGRNLIGEPSSVVFRKSKALRYFNSSYNQLVDLDMWFHLLTRGPMAYYAEPLTTFRVHETQATQRNINDLLFVTQEQVNIINDWINNDVIGLSDLDRFYSRMRMCGVYKRFYAADKIAKKELQEYIRIVSGQKSNILSSMLYRIMSKKYKKMRPKPVGELHVQI
jgi:hypothetical protein